MAEFRCKALRMSDQMVCRVCNLVWDVNDSEPPECKGPTITGWMDTIRAYPPTTQRFISPGKRRG